MKNLYYKHADGTGWYKYYCPKCKKWIIYSPSWNLATNGCEHYETPYKSPRFVAGIGGWEAIDDLDNYRKKIDDIDVDFIEENDEDNEIRVEK